MSFRVAIASSDGKYIDRHFGRASQFLVFEVSDKDFQFIETKNNTASHQGYQENVLIKTVELLADYELVMANKIGLVAMIMLKDKGVQSILFEGSIEDALNRLIQIRKNKIFADKKFYNKMLPSF
jgi:nitrogen fixation protein NifX